MALQVSSAENKRDSALSRSPEVVPDRLIFKDPREFKTHTTFENLLRIDADLLEKTTEDMRVNGYYRSKPVTFAVWPGQAEPVLIDGHMLRQAAINAGITSVPCVIEKFPNEMAVLQYGISSQSGRRVTTNGALYRLWEQFDRLLERGRRAQLIGCSYKTVDKIRKIEMMPRLK